MFKKLVFEEPKIGVQEVERDVLRYTAVPSWTQLGKKCALCGWEFEDGRDMVVIAQLDSNRIREMHQHCFDE